MESTTKIAEPKKESAPKPLTLFRVTLDWNPSNSDEGTYSSSAWATGYDTAIHAVAEEMSQHPDAAAETQAQKERFVQNTVRNAQSYAAECVASSTLTAVTELLSGPLDNLTEEASADLATIQALLMKYCPAAIVH